MAIITFIIFILVFSLLVFIHELGHFLASRISGVAVEEFAIGFGPKLFGFKWWGTDFSFRVIPLGGYVKPKGERGSDTKDSDAYVNQPLYKKLFILVAGVSMNFVLAVVLAALYLSLVNYQVVIMNLTDHHFLSSEVKVIPESLKIIDVLEDSPISGLITPGDLLVGFDDQGVKSLESFLEYTSSRQGEQISLTMINLDTYDRYLVETTLNIKSSSDDFALGAVFASPKEGETGIIPSFYVLNYYQNIFSGLSYSIDMFGYQIAALGSSIGQAVEQSNPGVVTEQLSGPVGILDVVGDILSADRIKELINLTVVLNLALAFFNLLPLPILDGGQIVLETLESIRGKKFSDKSMAVMMYITLFLFFLLFIVVLVNDLRRAGVIELAEGIIKSAGAR